MNQILVNFIFIVIISTFIVLTARGIPLGSTVHPKSDELSVIHHVRKSDDFGNKESVTQRSNCDPVELELKEVTFLKNKNLFLKSQNITIHSSEYKLENGTIYTCISFQPKIENFVLNCTEKFEYEKHEFRVLANSSAVVGRSVIPAGEYELRGDYLRLCAPEKDKISTGITVQQVSIYIGQVGSAISIISLLVHLSTFIFIPSLWNLPGYNLASLSVAFLLAYSFLLIGQIPQVVGVYCVVSAVLQHNFFLAAFFCMNVLAFDIWRTLKLATEKLVIGSQSSRKRKFIWYSLYAWGVPLIITTISVIVDYSHSVPAKFKPDYGKFDVCWMTNRIAKVIFFVTPAFSLLLVNAVFFILSFCMIFSNTMKVTEDQNKQNVKTNYILYVRLALMMGLTWLVGLIAIIIPNEVIWLIFDLLNSLQGLFLCLLFTCTKRVVKNLATKSIFQLSSMKQTSLMTNSSSLSTKSDSNGVKKNSHT